MQKDFDMRLYEARINDPILQISYDYNVINFYIYILSIVLGYVLYAIYFSLDYDDMDESDESNDFSDSSDCSESESSECRFTRNQLQMVFMKCVHDVGTELDIKELRQCTPGDEYVVIDHCKRLHKQQVDFVKIAMKMSTGKGVAHKIYADGKIHTTGCRTLNEFKTSRQELIDTLQMMPVDIDTDIFIQKYQFNLGHSVSRSGLKSFYHDYLKCNFDYTLYKCDVYSWCSRIQLGMKHNVDVTRCDIKIDFDGTVQMIIEFRTQIQPMVVASLCELFRQGL